jgi:hypothetical protein
LGNTLYLAALSYWTVITFLGYNALHFLHHTELLLSPMVFFVALWFISLFGFNMPEIFAPIMLTGVRKLGTWEADFCICGHALVRPEDLQSHK